jgi:hypothetical protein
MGGAGGLRGVHGPPRVGVGDVGSAQIDTSYWPVNDARLCRPLPGLWRGVGVFVLDQGSPAQGNQRLQDPVRAGGSANPDRRVQEVREYASVTPALLALADWRPVERVELVAMEATSAYWKPVFYLLEVEGFKC